MAIEKYTMRALVLNQYPNGENDIMLRLYTEDLGVIYALAKSLRKKDGKLKAHVRKYHYTNVTIVKGKEIYRLTGASEISYRYSLPLFTAKQKELNNLLPEAANLIEKYYQGEQKSSSLFKKIYNLMSLYTENNILNKNDTDTNNYRRSLYLILLIDLGYIDAMSLGVKNIEEYKNLDMHDILFRSSLYSGEINSQIRRALRESML